MMVGTRIYDILGDKMDIDLGIFDPDHPDMGDEVLNVREALEHMREEGFSGFLTVDSPACFCGLRPDCEGCGLCDEHCVCREAA